MGSLPNRGMSRVVSVLVVGNSLLLIGSVVSGAMRGAAQPSLDEIVSALASHEHQKEIELQNYTATRRYVLTNTRFKSNPEMLVRMQVTPERGKVFQVLSEHDLEGISKRVFRKVMDGESEISRTDAKRFNKVIPENYNFRMLGTEERSGRRCYVLEIKAKTRNKYMLDGKIFVDAIDYQLVRMEGRTAASMSFWVGKPYVVYDFQKVGEYWLAARNHSITDAKFIGTTQLTIEVRGYELQPGHEQKLALENLPQIRRALVE
jgi:outer membrane lipoprotein-sorting protein